MWCEVTARTQTSSPPSGCAVQWSFALACSSSPHLERVYSDNDEIMDHLLEYFAKELIRFPRRLPQEDVRFLFQVKGLLSYTLAHNTLLCCSLNR